VEAVLPVVQTGSNTIICAIESHHFFGADSRKKWCCCCTDAHDFVDQLIVDYSLTSMLPRALCVFLQYYDADIAGCIDLEDSSWPDFVSEVSRLCIHRQTDRQKVCVLSESEKGGDRETDTETETETRTDIRTEAPTARKSESESERDRNRDRDREIERERERERERHAHTHTHKCIIYFSSLPSPNSFSRLCVSTDQPKKNRVMRKRLVEAPIVCDLADAHTHKHTHTHTLSLSHTHTHKTILPLPSDCVQFCTHRMAAATEFIIESIEIAASADIDTSISSAHRGVFSPPIDSDSEIAASYSRGLKHTRDAMSLGVCVTVYGIPGIP